MHTDSDKEMKLIDSISFFILACVSVFIGAASAAQFFLSSLVPPATLAQQTGGSKHKQADGALMHTDSDKEMN